MQTQDVLADRHLVITGFTGFVAKVLVGMLLEEVPRIGRITLLVRPRGRLRPARRRVEEALETSPVFRTLRAQHGAGLAAWLSARIDAIDADLEQPGCGMSAEARARLASTDVLVHCAGLTDFAPDPLKALSANVAGAANAATLAEELGVPLVHVSTCYVAGNVGTAEVPETLTPGRAPSGAPLQVGAETRALQLACRRAASVEERINIGTARAQALGFPNIYTYTKSLAEHLLAQRTELDCTIVRPSIVECARQRPFPGWNEGLNTAGPLAWLISTPFRRLPTVPEHTFDVVPVDDVACGLAAITAAALTGRAGGVFQLASSDHNPFTFDRAVELTGLGMRRWTRRAGRPIDRGLLAHLDPIPVALDAQGPFEVRRLGRLARHLGRALRADQRADWVPSGVERALGPTLDRVGTAIDDVRGSLDRVEQMLELFQPFIHDNDWTFHTVRARELTAHEEVFRFDLSDLSWRDYWVDVEYPGLRTWCIPILEGERIQGDPPLRPRLQLGNPPAEVRVASK